MLQLSSQFKPDHTATDVLIIYGLHILFQVGTSSKITSKTFFMIMISPRLRFIRQNNLWNSFDLRCESGMKLNITCRNAHNQTVKVKYLMEVSILQYQKCSFVTP